MELVLDVRLVDGRGEVRRTPAVEHKLRDHGQRPALRPARLRPVGRLHRPIAARGDGEDRGPGQQHHERDRAGQPVLPAGPGPGPLDDRVRRGRHDRQRRDPLVQDPIQTLVEILGHVRTSGPPPGRGAGVR